MVREKSTIPDWDEEELFELLWKPIENIQRITEILVNFILKENYIYTTREDNKNEIWIYDSGVYVPNGRSRIKEKLRELLYANYNLLIVNKTLDKIETDTYIDSDKFFEDKSELVEIIPVENGLLNIRTRKIEQFNPEKIFFNKLPVEYNLNAKCPMIEKFLSDTLPSQDIVELFYEIAGFGLVKEYRYEVAFMFSGKGRNGKGKCLELLKQFVGIKNCCALPLSKISGDSFELSELKNKLFNLAGDIDHNDLEDTATFKTITGRDLVTAKRKFLNPIHFHNYSKQIFACNELPMVFDMTRGFWDRWILIDFPFTFVTKQEYDSAPENKKKNLKIRDENIISHILNKQELSGLLNKALDGFDRLTTNKGFRASSNLEELRINWLRKANSFNAFCLDNLKQDFDAEISKKWLRKKYQEYCKSNESRGVSDKVIVRTLQELFGADDRQEYGTGNRYWTGINWLKEEMKEPQKKLDNSKPPTTTWNI